MTNVFLTLTVVSAWLGTLAFLRMRTPLERIHATTFISVVTFAALALAGFTSQGWTIQTSKILLLWLVNLGLGALLSHACAHAIHHREGQVK